MIALTKEQVIEFEKQYELPLYIFNRDEFIQNYTELENTFREIYPKYRICYSYKTNYTPAICLLVKELGGYAEVVSSMEYQLAKTIGYEARKIVYNGPLKGDELENHILNGGINNVDRSEEAKRICDIADSHPERRLCTGIRVNFDVDAGYTSRFGIDLKQIDEIILMFREHNVGINGLHCHMSRARDINSWKKRTTTMLELVSKYDFTTLEYISLGSGMTGRMDPELKAQFPVSPSYEEYGEAVIRQFADFYSKKDTKPFLFTEPGTTIVSKYVDFLAKIEGIKEIRGKQFVLCNCSFHNLGETCQMKNLPVTVFPNSMESHSVKNADFVGYTCLEQDVLLRNFSGKIGTGDYILFGNVGGYSIVDKPPFIQPNCAMISVSNDETELVKRKESWEDIFCSFCYKE